jgi:hypothetical protein
MPLKVPGNTVFTRIFICMADMVAYYHGAHAAQILIIIPKPSTIIPA